jgi:hypothetical protein
MARIKPGNIFPSVSDSIDSFIIFWAWLFGLLAGSSPAGFENEFGAINPLLLFSVGFLGLGFVMFRQANSLTQLKEVLGLDVSIPGYGIFLTVAGIGFGFVFYGLYTDVLLGIAGSVVVTNIAQPFYNPVTASASSFTFDLREIGSIVLLHSYVGVFEEAYKIAMFKNLSNSFHKYSKKYSFFPSFSVSFILLASLLISIVFWGLWHYFSWNGLTLSSVLFSVIYGVAFSTIYFVAGAANIIEPDTLENKEVVNLLGGAVIYPNIGTHIAWNVLVSVDGAGLALGQLAGFGVLLIVFSFGFMYGLKKVY